MFKLNSLTNFLISELNHNLPGEQAHFKMAPYKRTSAKEIINSDKKPRKASTLLLLHEVNSEVNFTLIKRPDYNGTHGGQISFPGGKLELEETEKQAAIRETEEEIGISKSKISIIGELTKVYIPPSNFLITPFVGFMTFQPEYIPDSREVEKVLTVPLSQLLNEDLVKSKRIEPNKYGKSKFHIDAPYFELEKQVVWGATALILNEFKEILKRIN